jgi:hypothetical protein
MVTDGKDGAETPADVTDGEMLRAVTAVVGALGQLRGEQVTLAAAARGLARDFDDGRGVAENVARELRITVHELVGLRQASDVAAPPVDPIAKIQDDLARRRAQRKQATP